MGKFFTNDKNIFFLEIPKIRLKIIKFTLNWCSLTKFWFVNGYFHLFSSNLMLEMSFWVKKLGILQVVALKKREKLNFLVCQLGLRQWPKVEKIEILGFRTYVKSKLMPKRKFWVPLKVTSKKFVQFTALQTNVEHTKTGPF